ncbi:restriction endonuclease subunit S [Streptomyces sp. SLBN-134]|uniref:restriction endonuclease subunit S n=1 Tax=Streptomyces sp. SLBN-134 TaxID=2768456 RepID=UPI001150AC6C|nr:restriction endonuclease subunit S [Streptomyces sp. SLBN-134]TQL21240.1 type I restriction enzyme S subunit [Streptomyces sp. SLBN-134]
MLTDLEVDWVPVGKVGEVRMGKQLSPASSRESEIQFPYLRVANVLDGWIDYSDVNSMSFDALERKKYGLMPGDILLNEGQSLELVGRSAIYDGDPGVYCFQNTLIRFRGGARVIPEYAQAVFAQWLSDGTFASLAKKTTSIAHLGGDRFAKIPFPLIPVAQQSQIARILDSVVESERSLRRVMKKKLKIRDGLLDSILNFCEEGGKVDFVPCGEVIKMTGGAPLGQARPSSNGRYPIMSSGGLAGKGDRSITSGPAIVIGRVGEGAGSVHFAKGPVWVTDNALWVSRISPGWVAEFLAIYLRWRDLGKLRSQTGQPLITQGVINRIDIPRLKIDEQRKVVQICNVWDDEFSKSRECLRKLRSVRSGIIGDLLSSGPGRTGQP